MITTKSGFKAFEANGRQRWVAWAASAFRDREGEIFKTKALERYVAEAYQWEDHGKLWFYHLPIPIGDADFTGLFDRILFKMGTFADTEAGRKAFEYFAGDPPGWAVSVGFKHLKGDPKNGEYDWIWVFETSPVPAIKAAFPYGRFNTMEATKMTKLTKDQEAKLREVFGDNWQSLVGEAEETSKMLEAYGIDFKAVGGDVAGWLQEALDRLEDEPEVYELIARAVEMLADEDEDPESERDQKTAGDHPLARLARGTPLGPREPPVRARYKVGLDGRGHLVEVDTAGTEQATEQHPVLARLGAVTTEQMNEIRDEARSGRKAVTDRPGPLSREFAWPLAATSKDIEAAEQRYEQEQAGRKAIQEAARPAARFSHVTCPRCGFGRKIVGSLERTSRTCLCGCDAMMPTTSPSDVTTARKSATRQLPGGSGKFGTSGY